MKNPASALASASPAEDWTTVEVAKKLGLAVRSVQLMVDRGELIAWKTPGGHRRISRASAETWVARRHPELTRSVGAPGATALASPIGMQTTPPRAGGALPSLLLIEDSRHYQTLIALLVREHFPSHTLHVANDGIAGLLMAGRFQPEVLLVDLLLPGIDGMSLILGLKADAEFKRSRIIVVTSLDADALRDYAMALSDIPVIHKSRLVKELPEQLRGALAQFDAPAVAV